MDLNEVTSFRSLTPFPSPPPRSEKTGKSTKHLSSLNVRRMLIKKKKDIEDLHHRMFGIIFPSVEATSADVFSFLQQHPPSVLEQMLKHETLPRATKEKCAQVLKLYEKEEGIRQNLMALQVEYRVHQTERLGRLNKEMMKERETYALTDALFDSF